MTPRPIIETLQKTLPAEWQPADPPADPDLVPWYSDPERFAYLKIGATRLYVGVRGDDFVVGTHETGITASARLLPIDRITEHVVVLSGHEGVMGRPCPPLPKWPQIAAVVKWRRGCVAHLEESYRRALNNMIAEREYLETSTETV